MHALKGKMRHIDVGAPAVNSPEALAIPETDGPEVKYHASCKPLCAGNSLASGVAFYGDHVGGEQIRPPL